MSAAPTLVSVDVNEEALESDEHIFGTYKHPEFGSASEAYALKRQISDTVSEYLPSATMPSPRKSPSETLEHHQTNRTSRRRYYMTQPVIMSSKPTPVVSQPIHTMTSPHVYCRPTITKHVEGTHRPPRHVYTTHSSGAILYDDGYMHAWEASFCLCHCAVELYTMG